MIHIGQRIKEVFDSQPKSHNIEWFAAQLNCKRANIYNIFNRKTIDTELLMQISGVLGHDFFKDFSDDLLRSRGARLSEKQQIYDEMMDSMGRLLARRLDRVRIAEQTPYFLLNRWDKANEPFPLSKYKLYICYGEDADVEPHMHLYSNEEGFELRFTISEKPRMHPVKNYGTRSASDTFYDIALLVEKWLNPSWPFGMVGPLSNRMFAIMIYNTINPRPNVTSVMEGIL